MAEKENAVKKSGETKETKKSKGQKNRVEEPEKKEVKNKEEIEATLKGLETIKYPLITEKAVGFIESENKLTFIVYEHADKSSVKKAVEQVYKVKVNKVNIINDMKARKKAIVTIDKKFKAGDIATKMGVV